MHPQAGSLEGLRLGVRATATRTGTAVAPVAYGPDRPLSGVRRVGSLAIDTNFTDHREAATFELRLSNVGPDPVFVESVVLAAHWRFPSRTGLRYLKHGWQSWSQTEVRDLDREGEPPFASSSWMRGLHHVHASLPPDRAGWHESATLALVGAAEGGAHCLVGALETGRAFGVVFLRPTEDGVDLALEQVLEIELEPGEMRFLEEVRVALGPDPSQLLDAFASLWGRDAKARTTSVFQSGWCSWYRFFHEVTEDDLCRNLDALSAARDTLAVDVVQLDDGYQSATGDWLVTNEKFPSGLPALAQRIQEAGFVPGLWTAPFCAVPESRLAQDHPDWLLGDFSDPQSPMVGTFVPTWTSDGGVWTLDTTREEVIRHLEDLFRELVDMGFHYLKLDFLHAVAGHARAFDARLTRAARLRAGLEAIRHGAGQNAFLLGCGCPLGPAVGMVDGMRIGPDVAPSWKPQGALLPGIEDTLPSTAHAIRSTLLRGFMHGRLWRNDPDCLMARTTSTDLAAVESESLASAVGVTGGMVVFSDDVGELGEAERKRVAQTLETARAVDASGLSGSPRVLDFFGPESPSHVLSGSLARPFEAHFNRGDEERAASLSGEAPALQAHASRLRRVAPARELAVFCDFDGTFSIQDVGSTLAKTHRADLRPAVQERFLRREITAWESNMELLHGLPLPESELDAFLHTVELDPGAKDLLSWCRERGVRFEILSDGFDYNLERLQEIHAIRFDYKANRLHYEGDRWQIAPVAPDPACSCGTGLCKRAQIEAYRTRHPGAVSVHVGNGQVSDLCGAIAADRAFAKDTLAPALFARGEAYEPFDDLHDVIRILEEWGF